MSRTGGVQLLWCDFCLAALCGSQASWIELAESFPAMCDSPAEPDQVADGSEKGAPPPPPHASTRRSNLCLPPLHRCWQLAEPVRRVPIITAQPVMPALAAANPLSLPPSPIPWCTCTQVVDHLL